MNQNSRDPQPRGPRDPSKEPKAVRVDLQPGRFVVHLDDGRSLSVPLEWYPRLRDAPVHVQNQWEPLLGGLLIKWPALDLTLMVPALLAARGPVVPWGGEDD